MRLPIYNSLTQIDRLRVFLPRHLKEKQTKLWSDLKRNTYRLELKSLLERGEGNGHYIVAMEDAKWGIITK